MTKNGETENIKTELKQWETMMTASGELLNAFRNPAIPQNQKEKVLESLIQKSKPAKTTANFLRVLLRNGRLTEISQINEKFSKRSGRAFRRRDRKSRFSPSAGGCGKAGIKNEFRKNDGQARQPEL